MTQIKKEAVSSKTTRCLSQYLYATAHSSDEFVSRRGLLTDQLDIKR